MSQRDQNLPSLKSLIAFEAAVRLGSMTAAAKALDSTQPAISQRVRLLEDTIGSPLFDRVGNRLAANEAGRTLYREVSESLHRIERTVRDLQTKATPRLRKVTIAAHFGFAHLWLLPRLQLLEDSFAALQFEIVPVDRDDDKDMAQADIAVRSGRIGANNRPEQLLVNEVVYPVCSPSFAARYGLGPELQAGMLDTLPLLHMDMRETRWLGWEQWCELAGFAPPSHAPRIRYNNYPLLLNAAREGQGLALGWSNLVRPALEDGSLVAMNPVVERASHGYFMHLRYADNAVLLPVANLLQSEVKKEQASLKEISRHLAQGRST